MVLCPICEKAITKSEPTVYFSSQNDKEYEDPTLEEMHEMKSDVYHISCSAFTKEEIESGEIFPESLKK